MAMTIRTLIVEDDPMVSNINKMFLERIEAFQLVGTARNGEEALRCLAQKPVDLLLLDVYMPAKNGLELLRNIRIKGYKTDVILITAAQSPATIEEAMRLGVVDCILKPFDFERFRNALLFYKKRFTMFRSSDIINQQGIDSLQLAAEEGDEPLPKGLNPVTLGLIREALQRAGSPLSAQELASRVRLSRITTRKYLEYLAEKREITLDLKYSPKGRPTKLYFYAKERKKTNF
ncbi:response regulator [Bacillaceae bacterium]